MSSIAFDQTIGGNVRNLSYRILDPDSSTLNSNQLNLDQAYQQAIINEREEEFNEWYKKKFNSNNLNNKTFSKLTIKEIYDNFINTFRNITLELVTLFSSKEIKLKVSKENKENSFYKLIEIYIRNIFTIIFSTERLLYVGIFCCILSFFIYFIFVTK